MTAIKRIISALLSLLMLIIFVLPCFAASDNGFECLVYPDEAVTQFDASMLQRISSGDDYISNRGYDETALYISPFWSGTVNGKEMPVYASPVYDWVLDTGVLQSFEYIFINKGTELDIELSLSNGSISNVCVLPEKLNASAQINGNKIKAHISGIGTYTYLINNDSQEYAVTLFVRENEDEDAQIEKYIGEYGEDNVAVYEKGYYELDSIPTDKDVIYFKRGAFISINHLSDIRSDSDAQSVNYAPAMELNGKENAVVAGCGTVDFTKLDRRERNLINVNFCKNTTVENLILLNPNSWTVTAYGSEKCEFSGITVFGYRTNSDGINICGCADITVSDSFCRNGDDCFSAKATNENFECHDILFKDCIGWSCKARCFGITGEVERDIYNITFSDCAVIYRNAVWDLDRTASLAVAVETGSGNIDNVLFENIEIHKDTGRPIYCMVYGDSIKDCEISNIEFRNIKMNCGEKIKISSQKNITFFGKLCAFLHRILKKADTKITDRICDLLEKYFENTNSVSVTFENVEFNGKKIKNDCIRFFIKEGNSSITVSGE